MSNSTSEICQTFLDFFKSKGHKIIPSSSLIPKEDLNILFTNSGMNQFKNIFLGIEKSYYSRVATAQRCVRAGGKHNDLNHVGYTTRHHTFFNMLGNFSFGDYFKYDAIKYAWELLTSEHWFHLNKKRLLITVYETDNESYNIWKKEIGIPNEQIIRIGDNKGAQYYSDNFWYMGDTGPCGPCTEIFYDHGEKIYGSFPGKQKKIGDRYIELWNIVFIQFNRKLDGTMEPLSNYFIDSGMGLERIAAVLQNVHSNYDIDIFKKIINAIADITGFTDLNHKYLYIIADHIRSSSFLIADGVIPTNENRGYVLRRIIRRAILHANLIGIKDIFFYKIVDPLIEIMGNDFELLKNKQKQIKELLKNEEKIFLSTLKRGLIVLNQKLSQINSDTLDGKTAFFLYDTYGLPIEITTNICNKSNIKVDKVNFELAMKKQRSSATKLISKNFFDKNDSFYISTNIKSIFEGYESLELNSNVIAIIVNNKAVNCINPGQKAIVILKNTPFYPESGGQIGDQGYIKNFNNQLFCFTVEDTQKYGEAIGHIGSLIYGSLKIGDKIKAIVNEERRICISINHSAIHMLHAALREVLGINITQKGSLVKETLLRFDFSHFKSLNLSEIHSIEKIINTQIFRNLPIESNIMSIDKAKYIGAISLFSNKYDELVRVISIGNFSIELCCGTHTSRTGNIGLFRIISESAIASGIRRIEAVTYDKAITKMHAENNQLNEITQLLKVNNQELGNKVSQILEQLNKLKNKLQQLKNKIAIQLSINISSKAIDINGVKLLVSNFSDIEINVLRIVIHELKVKFSSTIILLATVEKGKIFIISTVSKNLTDKIKALELINMIAKQVGCKGGGNQYIAQAGGGTSVFALTEALSKVEKWVIEKLYN